MSSNPEKAVAAQQTPAKPAEQEALAPAKPAMPDLWTNPFAYMQRMHDELDRTFGTFGFGRRLAFPSFAALEMPKGFDEMAKAVWSPQVEVLERNGNLVVRADLPGLARDDVKVEIEDDLLMIKGERKSEKEEKNEKFYRSERSYGSFYRAFRIPEGTDASKVAATFKDGVLEVTLPAPEKLETTARKVEIEGT